MKIKTLLALALLINPILASGETEDDETVVAEAPKKKGRHAVDSVKNSHITVMDLSNERELTNIEFLVYFQNLRELNLEYCNMLKDSYHSVSGLTNLRKINLRDVKLTTTIHLRPLVNLTSLNLSANPDLTTVRDIITLTKLKKLDLGGNSELTDLERLAQLTSLRNLSLNGIFNNDNISYPSLDFIAALTNLRKLNLGSNDWLFYIKPLVGLSHLTHLDLSASRDIKDLPLIGVITTLEKLNLRFIYSGCPASIIKPMFLATLTRLRSLTMDRGLDIPPLLPSVQVHEY